MKKYLLIAIGALSFMGCARLLMSSEDVRALAPYQSLEPGTLVVLVMNVGIEDYTTTPPSRSVTTMEHEATIVRVTPDTLTVAIVLSGRRLTVSYAGKAIHEIRIGKKEPIQLTETTRGK